MNKQKVSNKKIVEKAELWRQDALTAPSAYRLYTYLPLSEIPEGIVARLDENAKKEWDEQISFEEIDADIDMYIRTILNNLANKRIMEAFLFIPVVLADLFILGKGVGRLEGKYRKHINDFADLAAYDRPLAEVEAVYDIAELVREAAKKVGIKLEYDLDEVVQEILIAAGWIDATTQELKQQLTVNQLDIDKLIDKALKEYEETTGESALKGVEEGIAEDEFSEEVGKN